MPVFEMESSMTPSNLVNSAIDFNDSGSKRKTNTIQRFSTGKKNSAANYIQQSDNNDFILSLNPCEESNQQISQLS